MFSVFSMVRMSLSSLATGALHWGSLFWFSVTCSLFDQMPLPVDFHSIGCFYRMTSVAAYHHCPSWCSDWLRPLFRDTGTAAVAGWNSASVPRYCQRRCNLKIQLAVSHCGELYNAVYTKCHKRSPISCITKSILEEYSYAHVSRRCNIAWSTIIKIYFFHSALPTA